MMREVPDINETERWVVETTLKERYGHPVHIQLADSDIRVLPSDRELTTAPTFYWEADGCHFVIFKIGEKRYRCQFYYRGFQQYGTGVPDYDDIAECTVAVLQAQADYVAEEAGDIRRRR